MAKVNNAVATVTPLSTSDIADLLGESGDLTSGGSFHRLTLKAGILVTDQGDMYPGKGMKEPAMVVRIVAPPVYYNAWFLTSKKDRENDGNYDPNLIGRPDLEGRFAKKYDDPNAGSRDQWANTDAYDLIEAQSGKRGKFKADIDLQILPANGQFVGNEPIYTLTLSTTGAIDFRGSSKDKTKGVAQDKNFIVQLAEFALAELLEKTPEADAFTQKKAVMDAMTALKTGNVVAGLYLPLVTSDDGSMSWTLPAFKPVFINETEEHGLLEAPAPAPGPEDEDLPV